MTSNMLDASRERLGLHSDAAELLPPPPYAGGRNGLLDRVVMGTTLVASEHKSKETISKGEIRDQVSRILESSMFVQSDRLGRFLRFTVEAKGTSSRPTSFLMAFLRPTASKMMVV